MAQRIRIATTPILTTAIFLEGAKVEYAVRDTHFGSTDRRVATILVSL